MSRNPAFSEEWVAVPRDSLDNLFDAIKSGQDPHLAQNEQHILETHLRPVEPPKRARVGKGDPIHVEYERNGGVAAGPQSETTEGVITEVLDDGYLFEHENGATFRVRYQPMDGAWTFERQHEDGSSVTWGQMEYIPGNAEVSLPD